MGIVSGSIRFEGRQGGAPMNSPRETLKRPGESGVENEFRPINLAFWLTLSGWVFWRSTPPTRQVRAGPREVIAEPRVLQVLITLSEAGSAVISREELVQRCWEGRITGEDAINRSIAKARRLAELSDPPAFMIAEAHCAPAHRVPADCPEHRQSGAAPGFAPEPTSLQTLSARIPITSRLNRNAVWIVAVASVVMLLFILASTISPARPHYLVAVMNLFHRVRRECALWK